MRLDCSVWNSGERWCDVGEGGVGMYLWYFALKEIRRREGIVALDCGAI